MFDDDFDSKPPLSNGAKFALLAGVPFIFLGLFFLLSPITDLRTHTGSVFDCGSALFAPSDEFKSNICGNINTMYLYKGLFTLVAGLVISAGGFLLFRTQSALAGAGVFREENIEQTSGSRQRRRTFD